MKVQILPYLYYFRVSPVILKFLAIGINQSILTFKQQENTVLSRSYYNIDLCPYEKSLQ